MLQCTDWKDMKKSSSIIIVRVTCLFFMCRYLCVVTVLAVFDGHGIGGLSPYFQLVVHFRIY